MKSIAAALLAVAGGLQAVSASVTALKVFHPSAQANHLRRPFLLSLSLVNRMWLTSPLRFALLLSAPLLAVSYPSLALVW